MNKKHCGSLAYSTSHVDIIEYFKLKFRHVLLMIWKYMPFRKI